MTGAGWAYNEEGARYSLEARSPYVVGEDRGSHLRFLTYSQLLRRLGTHVTLPILNIRAHRVGSL